MRQAKVFNHHTFAGILTETDDGRYTFEYTHDYAGKPVSLSMPVGKHFFEFDNFPPFFDGLLPEGAQLDALLKRAKLDKNDLFGQLLTVGKDLVGSVAVGPLS